MEVHMDDENVDLTISELISYLKSAFRPRHFAEVEEILIAKEEKYKREIEEMMMKIELMEERDEFVRLDNLAAEKQLKERVRKVKVERDFWKDKVEELEIRVSLLEEDIGLWITPPCAKLDGDCVVLGELKGEKVQNESGKVRNGNGNTNSSHLKVREGVLECDDNIRIFSSLGHDAPTKAKGDMQRDGRLKLASGGTVVIIDSEDNCGLLGHSSVNKTTCEKPSGIAHSDETGVVTGIENLKRKRDSHVCTVDSESDTQSAKCIMKKPRVSIPESNGSPVQQYSTTPVSSGLKLSPSRLAERILNYRLSEFGVDGYSSSDSDDDTDSDSSADQSILKFKSTGTWESEARLLCDIYADDELCLKAVCALYRQQKSAAGKTCTDTCFTHTSVSIKRGFDKYDLARGTTLAEFLIDGDPQGKLRKSVEELLKHDPKGLETCRRLAMRYTNQLFDIYQKRDDPFFPSC